MNVGDKVITHSAGKWHEGVIHNIQKNDVATIHIIDKTGATDVMYCRIIDLKKTN